MHSLGEPVELARIDGRLRELWDNNEAATRASLMNFAVFSECDDCLERNTELIGEITRDHACRAILIAARPGEKKPGVEAWITAHCQLTSAGQKSICSEQVSFLLHGTDAALIRNIVFAHLDSDLPLVFWWQGPFSDLFDDQLYTVIDRLVIDSAEWDDPLSQLARLRGAKADAGSRFVCYDLNWARLLPYRLALAGLFDYHRAQQEIPRIDRIEIACRPGDRTAAVFMLAWIASRLQRRVESAGPEFAVLAPARKSQAARIEAAITEDEEATGPLNAVTLRAGEDAVFRVLLPPESHFLHATVDLDELSDVEHIHPLGPTSQAGLVSEILSRGGTNSLYFKTHSLVRALLQKA